MNHHDDIYDVIINENLQGPYFPDDYVPLPKDVRMKYNGKSYKLEPASEEVMTFYAGMLRTDYVTDPGKSKMFNANFFKDWRKTMTDKEKEDIKDLSKVRTYFCKV